jgi:hypothetical protein
MTKYGSGTHCKSPEFYQTITIRAIAAQYPDMHLRAFIEACLLAQMLPIEIDDSV